VNADELLLGVELHLLAVLGQDSGRARVSFLGTDEIQVLRFGPDDEGLTRYATLGMSGAPMSDPAETVATDGPRVELLLSLRQPQDDVFRTLAVIAASPSVEGLVLAPGAGIDLGQPLWEGSPFSAVLVAEPGGLVPDLGTAAGPVRFLPLLPMTRNEAAWKRVHGAAALEERWLIQGTDLRDPWRAEADLA
jgi:hypothetical protein